MRRRLGIDEVAEWNDLQESLELVQLSAEEDMVTWALEASGKFSTKSLYKFMKNSGQIDLRMTEIWNSRLPLKIKIFLWMLWHNRVQTEEQLKIRKGKGSERCKYCGKLDSRNHLLFNCAIAQVIWVWVRISLRWDERPTSVQHFEDMMGLFGLRIY